jgi:hypothetical protein
VRHPTQDWAIEELVASLKADTAAALVDEQAVFAKVDGQWKAGLVVLAHSGNRRYSVLVDRNVFDLDRDSLCARVALPEPAAGSELTTHAQPALVSDLVSSADLSQSLKLNKLAEPVPENVPVLANVGGHWQMGMVISARSDTQQHMMYSIRFQHGIYDLPRDKICPHVPSQAKQARRRLPRWQPGIFSKRSKPPPPTSPATASASSAPALPSAAAALPSGPQEQERETGDGTTTQAVAEGVLSLQDSLSSNNSAWSLQESRESSDCQECDAGPQACSRGSLDPVVTDLPRRATSFSLVSASLKSLLIRESEQSPRSCLPGPVVESHSQTQEVSGGPAGADQAAVASSEHQPPPGTVDTVRAYHSSQAAGSFALCVSVHNGMFGLR